MADGNTGWPKLSYHGSVKDIYGPLNDGSLVFKFSDRYSIFDWGEMPDQIPQKGLALAVLGDLFFRVLAQKGVQSHSVGLVDDNLQPLKPGSASRNLQVKAVPVNYPHESRSEGAIVYDYSFYQSRPESGLVPLEVIFRFGVPTGSSLLRRLSSAPEYAAELGLAGVKLEAGQWLPAPIVEFSTKLEPTDRMLSLHEASIVAGLTVEEMAKLKQRTLETANVVREIYQQMGIELWDGKFEFAFQEGNASRDFLLVDTIGPDELRLLSGGVQVSKEYLRQHYTGSPWELAVRKAKSLAKERGQKDWKSICRSELSAEPEPLPNDVLTAVSEMYRAMANGLARIAGYSDVFHYTHELEFVIKTLRKLKETSQ